MSNVVCKAAGHDWIIVAGYNLPPLEVLSVTCKRCGLNKDVQVDTTDDYEDDGNGP